MHARFLLFGQSRQTMARVGNVLVGAGYAYAGHTDDIPSLLRTVRSCEPDFLVMDPPDNMHEVMPTLQILEEEWLTATILMIGYPTREVERMLEKSQTTSWIPKPVQEETVLPMVSQSLKTFRYMSAQQREIARLRKALDERRLLERAKWVLGRQMNLSESEAYDVIRNRSRDTRQPMAKVAEAILLTADFHSASM